MSARARRSRARFLLGLFLGALPVFVVAVFAVVSDLRGDDGDEAAEAAALLATERTQLRAYEKAIEPIVEEGSFAVAMGMQPGTADIANGAFGDDVLVDMADGWLGTMRNVRRDFEAVEVPPFLAESARLLEAAIDGYIETAEALLAAARATGDERAQLVQKAPPLGRRADKLYDRSEAELDRHRRRLGIDEGRR